MQLMQAIGDQALSILEFILPNRPAGSRKLSVAKNNGQFCVVEQDDLLRLAATHARSNAIQEKAEMKGELHQ